MTDPLTASRRRLQFALLSRPIVRLPATNVWGQAEQRIVDRLLAIDPADALRTYLDAAGPASTAPDSSQAAMPQGTVRWPEPLLAGTFLSACAMADSARPDSGLTAQLTQAVALLERCRTELSRRGAPAGGLIPATADELAALQASADGGLDHVLREAAELLIGLVDVTQYTSIDCASLAAPLGAWLARTATAEMSAAGVRPSGGPLSNRGSWSVVAEALSRLALSRGERREVRVAALRLQDAVGSIRVDRPLADATDLRAALDDAIGALALFVLGDDSRFDTAEELCHRLLRHHIGPAGGVRVRGDRFAASDAVENELASEHAPAGLGAGDEAPGCGTDELTARAIELAAIVLACEPDADLGDYLELAGGNFLATTGSSMPGEGVARDVPFGPAVRVERDQPPGSPSELMNLLTLMRLRHSIFMLRGDEVSLNLYVPASMVVPGSGAIHVARRSAGRYRIDIEGEVPGKLRVRWPGYASTMQLRIDGVEHAAVAEPDGYVIVPGARRPGEVIEIDFEWTVRALRVAEDPARFAILYGPWVMVALTDQPDWLRWAPSALADAFRAGGRVGAWQLDGIPLTLLRVVGNGVFHSVFVDPDA